VAVVNVAARWATALVLVLAGAAGLRVIFGPVIAALILAPILWGAMLAGWAAAERRVFDQPAALPAHRPQLDRSGSAHLDAARADALAQLADLYLDHLHAGAREVHPR